MCVPSVTALDLLSRIWCYHTFIHLKSWTIIGWNFLQMPCYEDLYFSKPAKGNIGWLTTIQCFFYASLWLQFLCLLHRLWKMFTLSNIDNCNFTDNYMYLYWEKEAVKCKFQCYPLLFIDMSKDVDRYVLSDVHPSKVQRKGVQHCSQPALLKQLLKKKLSFCLKQLCLQHKYIWWKVQPNYPLLGLSNCSRGQSW